MDADFIAPCDGCSVETGATTTRCSRCKCAWYHGRDCQRAHYSEHKTECLCWVRHMAEWNAVAEKAKTTPAHDAELTDPEEVCGICLDRVASGVRLACAHRFCHECLKEYLRICPTARCPFCRSFGPALGQDVLAELYRDAAELCGRANRRPTESAAKTEELRISLDKADQLLQLEPDDVLYYLGEFDACVAHLSQCAENETFGGEQIGNFADFWVTDYLTIALCCMDQPSPDVGRALVALDKALEQAENSRVPKHVRELYYRVGICCSDIGQFDEAIRFGMQAVAINRHYEHVYSPVARAYEGRGDLDGAVRTMQQAVCYETPWDAANVVTVRARLKELVARRQKQRETIGADSDLSDSYVCTACGETVLCVHASVHDRQKCKGEGGDSSDNSDDDKLQVVQLSIPLRLELQEQSVFGELGTGGAVWAAGVLLAEWCARELRAEATERAASAASGGRRLAVLELGCGAAPCAGIACAALGCDVLLTDLAPVLPFAAANARRNAGAAAGAAGRGACETAELAFGAGVERATRVAAAVAEGIDVVLCSDCVFKPELHEPLARSLATLLRGGSGGGGDSRAARCAVSWQSRSGEIEPAFFAEVCPRFGLLAKGVEVGDLVERMRGDGEGGAKASRFISVAGELIVSSHLFITEITSQ